MRKHRPNYRLVKIHRSYTVEEIARLFGAHKNTVRACHDLLLIELTEKGHRQAREVAAAWKEVPSLLVTSRCLRTQQTAAPTSKRFPQVAVETWPIQEFTYLEPSRWNGTSRAWRLPHLEAYWAKADPECCDGPGAESFATLLIAPKLPYAG